MILGQGQVYQYMRLSQSISIDYKYAAAYSAYTYYKLLYLQPSHPDVWICVEVLPRSPRGRRRVLFTRSLSFKRTLSALFAFYAIWQRCIYERMLRRCGQKRLVRPLSRRNAGSLHGGSLQVE